METTFKVEPTDWLLERDQATIEHQFRRFVGGLGPYLEQFGTIAKVTGERLQEEFIVKMEIDEISAMTKMRIRAAASHDGFAVIEEEKSDESSFAKLFSPDGGEFDSEYARLYAINFGGSAVGAEKLHKLLKTHCRPGYIYFGRWPKDGLNDSIYSKNPDFYFVDEAYDVDGNVTPDYVSLFKKVNKK